MILRVAAVSPKTSLLLSHFRKSSNTLLLHSKCFSYFRQHHTCSLKIICNARELPKSPISMERKARHFSSASAEALVKNSTDLSNRMTKKARREAPDMILRVKLDQCSKIGDFAEALRLYEEAKANTVPLNLHHYNVLLYLCSSSGGSFEKGFEIFKQMGVDNVAPNEATFTNISRLAASREDPELAFTLVKQMKNHGIAPKLRSYGPALFGFCNKGMADEAYEVDSHMVESGVSAEEAELSALLRVSSRVEREGKVYEFMHRLRAAVRQVSEETASVVEDWFSSRKAAEVGAREWDVGGVRKGVLEGGGGWHGQGWLGEGSWRVVRTRMNEAGICQSCGEKLVCIDIDPEETENFAKSLAKLASQREVKNNFAQFQEWLQRHSPFDAVVDGANLGLANQRTFNFGQIERVVNQLRQISPSKKLPLVVLHQARVKGGPAQKPNNKKLLESWKKVGALYATPQGSNDDWYWLYAAVSSKCLLVTNDEMRDHLFNLLGNSFFPRWKEKHQVRLKYTIEDGLTLCMPPPYSIVIQESERGRWHVPTVTGDDLEAPRQWICATRATPDA
ncbi:proteinaceous RNase P 1, chloroplastic/mitochondrial-like [Salvia miltiorrhiza]|uniref:proteinaceous RNase P 1, chloroplastic/mitochondrial-like n=1 Tax=Salvia miltiorrhiza TaxID=226208 RepID=UPI0025AC6FE2|nr:proteinaceous RNase P 1, chloroplastic/mitochondrial-like [Salvia miltiorrhiza]